MYALGQGVARDDAEAVRWYLKAAEQGIAVAQSNLGTMYRLGQGVAQEFANALNWYWQAAEQNDAKA